MSKITPPCFLFSFSETPASSVWLSVAWFYVRASAGTWKYEGPAYTKVSLSYSSTASAGCPGYLTTGKQFIRVWCWFPPWSSKCHALIIQTRWQADTIFNLLYIAVANSPDCTAQNRDGEFLYQVWNIMNSVNIMDCASIWYCVNFKAVFLKLLECRHSPNTGGSVMWQRWYGKYGVLTLFLFGPSHTHKQLYPLVTKQTRKGGQTARRLSFQQSGLLLQF